MRLKIRCDRWKRKYFGFAWEVNRAWFHFGHLLQRQDSRVKGDRWPIWPMMPYQIDERNERGNAMMNFAYGVYTFIGQQRTDVWSLELFHLHFKVPGQMTIRDETPPVNFRDREERSAPHSDAIPDRQEERACDLTLCGISNYTSTTNFSYNI
jgi:hypothetical protein